MNKVVLMGRLTRDPDVRYTQGENPIAIANFTLAVDRRRTSADGQREADFISCVAFRKQAEFAEKYLNQGTKVALSGSIQTGSYNNKDGTKVKTTEVIVDEIEFAESKAAGQKSKEASTTQNADSGEGFLNIPDGVEDEGLPFN